MILEKPDFFVLNKPIQVHFDEAITQCSKISSPQDWEPVHRLDFETSGCLLVARKEKAALMRELFKNREVKKLYIVGASHELGAESLNRAVDGFILSRYRSSKKVKFVDVLHVENEGALRRKNHAVQPASHLVRAANAEELEAGRKLGFTGTPYTVDLYSGARHQIRAFFAAADAALVGDPIYGTPSSRLELHAYRLEFDNPFNPGERIQVSCP